MDIFLNTSSGFPTTVPPLLPHFRPIKPLPLRRRGWGGSYSGDAGSGSVFFLPTELHNFRHQCPRGCFDQRKRNQFPPSSTRERSLLRSGTRRDPEETGLHIRPHTFFLSLPAPSVRTRLPRRKRSLICPEIGGAAFSNPFLAISQNSRETRRPTCAPGKPRCSLSPGWQRGGRTVRRAL